MSATWLNEQGVNGADLNPMTATGIADLCGLNMVLAIRLDEGKSSEALDDAVARLRASEALEKFLQHEPRAEHLVSSEKCIAQRDNFRCLKLGVPAQSQ